MDIPLMEILANVPSFVRDVLSRLKNVVVTCFSFKKALFFTIRDTVRVTASYLWDEVLESIVVWVLEDDTVIKAIAKAVQLCTEAAIEDLGFIGEIITEILERCLKRLRTYLLSTAKEATKVTAKEATKVATKVAGKKVAKKVAKKLAKKAAKLAGKEAAMEVIKTGTLETAKKSAKKAFFSAAAVDVTLLGLSATYNLYLYNQEYITKEEFKKYMTMRVGATGGSIAGTTAGAFVGTVICPFLPGVGTFLGGYVGGMVGDYLGSATGQFAHDNITG